MKSYPVTGLPAYTGKNSVGYLVDWSFYSCSIRTFINKGTRMSWEYLGYFASVLLVASLMMSNVTKLRWLNLAGCIAFTVYGIAITAWPVAITNGLLAVVNLYHLFKLHRYESEQQS